MKLAMSEKRRSPVYATQKSSTQESAARAEPSTAKVVEEMDEDNMEPGHDIRVLKGLKNFNNFVFTSVQVIYF